MGCKQSQPKKIKDKKLHLKTEHLLPKKFKVVLLGGSSVGKTTLATHYCLGNGTQQYGPTVGGVYFKKDCQLQGLGQISINIWDTAGQQKYRSMASLYYRDADVILLVFDLTDQASFYQLQYWIGELDVRIQKKEVIVIVVGNKADQNGRSVSRNLVDSWLKNYSDFWYMEVSASNGKGVNQTFQLASQLFFKKARLLQH